MLGRRRTVNRNTDTESDQFLPAVTVDDQGRIHVILYDDRAYRPLGQHDGQQEPGEAEPRFDVYYAVSVDQGQSWIEQKLVLEPVDEPAADLNLEPLSDGFELGEYVGITWYAPPGAGPTEIWTAFTGTLSTDDDPAGSDKSVIYYSQHTYPNP